MRRIILSICLTLLLLSSLPDLLQSFHIKEIESIYGSEPILDRIDPLLFNTSFLAEQRSLENGLARLIVKASDLESVFDAILMLGGRVYGLSKRFNFLYAWLPYDKLYNLASFPSIRKIYPDILFHACLNESVPAIKDPVKWSLIEERLGFEVNGSGIVIAILDTGIDKSHPDLDDLDDNPLTNDPKVIGEVSFIDFNGDGVVDEDPMDYNGHGTHCASIAAGTGAASNGKFKGVAPGAYLLNVKVLSASGVGYDSWIISGIEWAVEHGANVISMSLGALGYVEPLAEAIKWAIEEGVIVVAAAGNEGFLGSFSIDFPASMDEVIAVGACAKPIFTIPRWSSIGPTCNWSLKPDILAPGVNITAARAHGTSMGYPVNEYYTRASGTSMATPHVAGAAALLLQVHPDWRQEDVKAALIGYARDTLFSDNYYVKGAGVIDVCRSILPPLLMYPANLRFGLALVEGTEKIVKIRNLTNSSLQLNLKVKAFLESGFRVSCLKLNCSSITIPPLGEAYVKCTVPIEINTPIGNMFGSIIAEMENAKCKLIFNVITLSVLNITVKGLNGEDLDLHNAIVMVQEVGDLSKYWISYPLSMRETSIRLWGHFMPIPFALNPGTYIVRLLYPPFAIDSNRTIAGIIFSNLTFIEEFEVINYEVNISKLKPVKVQISPNAEEQLIPIASCIGMSGYAIKCHVTWQAKGKYDALRDKFISGTATMLAYVCEDDTYVSFFMLFEAVPRDFLNSSFSPRIYFIGWTDFDPISTSSLAYSIDELSEIAFLYDIFSTPPFNETLLHGIYYCGQFGEYPIFFHVERPPMGARQTFYVSPGFGYWFTYLLNYLGASESSMYSWAEVAPFYSPGQIIPWLLKPTSGERYLVKLPAPPIIPARLNVVNSSLFLQLPILRDSMENVILGHRTPTIEVYRNSEKVFEYTDPIHPEESFFSAMEGGISLCDLQPGNYVILISENTCFPIYSLISIKYTLNYDPCLGDVLPPWLVDLNLPPYFTPGNFTVSLSCADDVGVEDVSMILELYPSGETVSLNLTSHGNRLYKATVTIPDDTQLISRACIIVRDVNGNTLNYTIHNASIKIVNVLIQASIRYWISNDTVTFNITGRLFDEHGHDLPFATVNIYLNENYIGYTFTNETGYFTYSFSTSCRGEAYNVTVEAPSIGHLKGSQTSRTIVLDRGPPIIKSIKILPESPFEGENVTVKAIIYDNMSDMGKVILKYRVDNLNWTSIEMTYLNGSWIAQIPGQKAGATVEFFIEAYDAVGNNVRSQIMKVSFKPKPEKPKIEPINVTYLALAIIVLAAIVAWLYFKRRRAG